MRVTQFTQYNNFILNQQKTLDDLNTVQTQISTGEKIQNMYEDPAVYTKFLKLNEEITSLTQVKDSATFAQTFANETDTTLNDFVNTLGTFKTNLLKAANETNDETSREAIVSELESELAHLKDLANTSIDGKYLFSGSKFNTKPIDDNYEYQGNDQYVKAFLGAGVEREYNIPGSELFLGRDNDYVKHISTNVVQYDKMKANPEFVVRGADGNLYIDKDLTHDSNGNIYISQADSDNSPINEPITGESQIRMLTGVADIDNGDGTYSDGKSYFYIKGKKANGETIDVTNPPLELSNSATVNDLLDKIGELYGNTATSKVVDVSLNDMGEIQIKDIVSGKMLTDFYMVASDTKESSIDDLVKNGDYIVEFQKSGFNSIRNQSTIEANNSYFDNRVFKFGAVFKTIDTKRDALAEDKVYNILGSEGISDIDGTVQPLNSISFTGTDTSGNNVNSTLHITSATTMHDILNEIKSLYGNVDVKLENGEIIVTDNSVEKTQGSSLSIKMQALDTNGNPLEVFANKDVANFDKLYMDKSGNEIKGNVSQIQNDYRVYFKDNEKIIEKNPFAQQYATNDTSIIDTMGDDTLPKTINLKFKDINGNLKTAVIELRDTPDVNGHLSNLWVDSNNDGIKEDSEVYDIFEPNGDLTPGHTQITTTTAIDPVTCEACTVENTQKGLTYQQLSDVVAMVVTNNLPSSNSADDYNQAVKSAREIVDAGVDEKGRFYLKDKSNSATPIDLSISTDDSSLYFQANNAITIDSPEVDFFDTLQKAIDAVKNGMNYPDSEKNPRNFGIQGAIEAIGHVTDHIRREHAKIGAVSNEFEMTIQRVDMLTLNVQQLQSDNIDTDLGESAMQLSSLQTSYQALLASIAKINNLTLLNYL